MLMEFDHLGQCSPESRTVLVVQVGVFSVEKLLESIHLFYFNLLIIFY